ncbi:CBS domain-containing protein [Kitasatospora sp. NPDC085879]|uniref:CBS domain-containing protein n=1 Tax=Kitasatospora sp. NPDC085879 TaxID=3154769 RepID=UPI000BD327E3|nr:CBS domain-containing protein [Streptomyces sp. TLI_235]PBC69788.1 hypothetical protein BX265_7141 [Streptomyces sp. TLI_235]
MTTRKHPTTPTTPTTAGRHGLTAADAMEPCGPRITAGASIEQADRLLTDTGATCLLVCTDDDRCQGLVTPASLAPFLACTWYTAHSRVSDAMRQCGPFAWPTLALSLAAMTMHVKRLDPWPVVDDDGYLLGVLSRTRVTALLAAPTLRANVSSTADHRTRSRTR